MSLKHPPDHPGSSRRLVLCLVADDDVMDRFPVAARFLQIGLIDEPVDVVLVAPEHGRLGDLAGGHTAVVTYRRPRWPLRSRAFRRIADLVRTRIDALARTRDVIVHGLSLTAAPLASMIREAAEGDMVLNVSSAFALKNPDLLPYLDEAAALISPAAAVQEILAASPLTSRKLETVPFGVAADDAPAAFRSRHSDPTILYAGGLTPEAGVDDLFQAMSSLTGRHPTLQTFVLGRGQAEPALRRSVDALGIASRVTLAGPVEQLRAAMRGADIFCVPRAVPVFREEPIHALAAGLALVCAAGVMVDGLMHRHSAMLFPSGDVPALAEQIDFLLENREFARSMAATGQAYARSHHSVSGMVKNYLSIYRGLANRHHTLSMPSKNRSASSIFAPHDDINGPI